MSQGMFNRMSKRHCPVDLRTSLHSIPVTGLWKQVGVDLIGPLPVTAAKRLYIITLSDFYSKWPETKAVPDKTAASTSNFITDVMMRLQRAVPAIPTIAYKRPRNLRDLLVLAAVPPPTSNSTPIQHDRTSRCIVCSHHLVESNSITSHSLQLTHKTKGHITSTTCNVIYLISCSRVCGIQYVGETKTTLKKRFHRSQTHSQHHED
ncbi:uncharacterized protein [Apostichopus japonicus]|uniref:uncharacterized protein n=1 Tax=Stichopus japonicus TaxID=307972 RepID=UPI003AB55E77